MGFLLFLYVYLLGGITFIPIAIVTSYYVCTYIQTKNKQIVQQVSNEEDDRLVDDFDSDQFNDLKAGEIEEALQSGVEAYMTGWIIVTKEYLQSISNIPTTSQSVNETAEHKSAYSSLYKFVKSTDNSTNNEASSTNTNSATKIKQANRKHRYFGVLRHGNLFLYKDETKTDVQHVIVLSNHIISIWPRNLLEGEIFSKVSSICIMKKKYRNNSESLPPISSAASLNTQSSNGSNNVNSTLNLLKDQSENAGNNIPPKGSFFIYCDLNIEKEDWYFALIRATKREYSVTNTEKDLLEPSVFARTLHFNTKDMISLIQTLHSSEGQLHTRWLNALIGRLYLSLQKTEVFQNVIKNKFSKKLSKINKPGFLDDFKIEKIDVGTAAPFLTYPILKDLGTDGAMCLAANFHYTGNLSFQISTKVNINLGSRFKAREFDVLLAVTFKKIEGRLIIKLKPPPSNRLWYGFETTPKIDLEIEPIVSSSKITYSLVTKTIENKFKEAILDSLVLPNMDDLSFFGTMDEIYRGGIWDRTERPNISDQQQQVSINIDDADESVLNDIDEMISDYRNSNEQNNSNNTYSLKKKSSFSKLKTSSSFSGSSSPIKLANKLKRDKSATISVSEDQYLADGSFVPISANSSINNDNFLNSYSPSKNSNLTVDNSSSFNDLSDDESISDKKKHSNSTLKKLGLGKWYYSKDEKERDSPIPLSINTSSTTIKAAPEMIQSRRPPRKASNPELNKFVKQTQQPLPIPMSDKENRKLNRKPSYDSNLMFNKASDIDFDLDLPPPPQSHSSSLNQFGSPTAHRFAELDFDNLEMMNPINPPAMKSLRTKSSNSSLDVSKNRSFSNSNGSIDEPPALPPRNLGDNTKKSIVDRLDSDISEPLSSSGSGDSSATPRSIARRKNTLIRRAPPPIDFPGVENDQPTHMNSAGPPLPPRSAESKN